MLILPFVLAGCSYSGDSNSIDEMQIQEGYDQLENEQIVFFLSYLDFESRYFAGYFVDAKGCKHYYELGNIDIQDFTDEVIYSFLSEHSTEFPGEEFLSNEEINRCYAYLTRVDENAEIIKETEPIYDAPGVELTGVRKQNGVIELIPICEKSTYSWVSTDEYTEKIIKIFGENEWFLERKSHALGGSNEREG